MPGHTPGTISLLFEYRDNGRRIKVAYVGGTAISFTNPDPAYYDQYIASAQKFAQAAAGFAAAAEVPRPQCRAISAARTPAPRA